MKQPTIVSLGEVLWDLFPDGERFGGAPANFACHTAILGGDVSMASAVGDDDRGRAAIRILNGYGVQTDLMQVNADAATGTVGVTLDDNGKPTYSIRENAAWDQLIWNSELEACVSNALAVYFGSLGQRSAVSRTTIGKAVRLASEAGVPRILDINLRPPYFDATLIRESVEHASILKLSDEELSDVSSACNIDMNAAVERQLRQLVDTMDMDYVVMTRGADGATLATRDEIVNHPGVPTKVQDTVGAGDSFTAAFLLGILRGDSHQQTLRLACEVASKTCAHSGAVP